MKNKFQILVLTILTGLLCLSFFIIFEQNKQLKSLKIQLAEQEKTVTDLKQEKQNLTSQTEVHPIEKAVQECMKKENYTTTGMLKCVDESINDWNKEIDKYLLLLKETLPKEQYDLLEISQNKWEEYQKAQWTFLNSVIIEKQGTMYINVLSGDRADVVEKRAKDLSGLYFELND